MDPCMEAGPVFVEDIKLGEEDYYK